MSLRYDSDQPFDSPLVYDGDAYRSPGYPEALPVVLVELDLPASGGTLRFTDVRYVDAAANVIADARLARSITFDRSVSTIYWGGGRSRAGIGDIELHNEDGALDYLEYQDLRDAPVRVLLGDDRAPLAAFVPSAHVIVEDMQGAGERSLRLVTASAAAPLTRNVQQSFYTSGNQLDRPMTRTYGDCFSVPALPTDIASLRFSTHDTSNNTVVAVYDRGATLTPTVNWLPYNTSPHFGFVLQQSTEGRITADVRGAQFDPGYSPFDLQNVVQKLLSDAGWTLYSRDQIEALQSELGTLMRVGCFVDGSLTYAQVLDDVADTIGGYWHINRLGQFRMQRLSLPSGGFDLALGSFELVGDVDVAFDPAAGLSDTILGRRNWHVYSTDELAGSVRDTAAGLALTQDYRDRRTFTVPDCYAHARGAVGASREVATSTFGRSDLTPSSTGARRPTADHGQPTLLVNATGLVLERNRRATLWAAARYIYKVTAELDRVAAATLDPHAVVELTVDLPDGSTRYWLDKHLLRVISVRGVLGEGKVELVLWGAAPAGPILIEEGGGKE